MELKDRVPPHNLDAEKATLGAILLDWSSIGDVISYLRSDNFYSLQNQTIFESMTGLFARGVRGDMLTLIDDLTKTGNLEKAGG
ncbi:MAG: replicative DNA helicase, partial [Treponema sp.]|nr:replicative DNA helicase [Treponema sp.]